VDRSRRVSSMFLSLAAALAFLFAPALDSRAGQSSALVAKSGPYTGLDSR